VSVPSRPFSIYEINTWVWLSALSEQSKGPVDLGSVPSAEWDAIARYGFDVVWLMGVWERSPAGIAIANGNANLVEDLRHALPDFRPEDNVGSAYCVRRYVVDKHLGGPEGLAIARQELARRGMDLLLDFVPNHVAPDAPWIVEHPEHFVEATVADLQNHPASYIRVGERIFACGRDPYFPPWPDVVQVNAFDPGFRAAVIQLLLGVADQCDGIRCDMAMLLINNIFARTWGGSVGPLPATEYWPAVINAIRQQHPHFLFVAEAYWDLEWELQQQGFDFCYDKRLYDLLDHGDAEGIRVHLGADLAYQEKLIRFIENHDEPRAAAAFSPAKERAAAITIATLPGAKLFHEGQFEGRRIRVPVFLGRRPDEAPDSACQLFYNQLLAAVNTPVFRDGQWALCPCLGWPDNLSCQKLGAWCWTRDNDRCLVIVNLNPSNVQARVHVPWVDLIGRKWRLNDALSEASYDRDGDEIQNEGLYVDLAPWVGQILSFHVISGAPSSN
jgi:glycosidase